MATIKRIFGESSVFKESLDTELLEVQIKPAETSRFDDLIISHTDISGAVNVPFKEDPGASARYSFDRVITREVPIANPAYEKADEQYGVLKHIDAPRSMYLEARHGIRLLREELKGDDGADNLVTRIKAYIESQYENDDLDDAILDRFFGDAMKQDATTGKKRLRVLDLKDAAIPRPDDKYTDEDGNEITENDHSALFGTGRVIRNDIREVQLLRTALLHYRRWQQRQIKIKQGERERIREQIPVKHRELASLNRQRIEARGDYQVVQQLVRENWEQVAKDYAQRAEILNNHRGLFYARVRETPFNRRLPRELPLRHVSPDDVVPGCPMEDQDMPAELEAFMDTVLDIPIADWTALRPHYRELPSRKRLLDWSGQRESRMKYRLNNAYTSINSPLKVRMSSLHKQNHLLIRDGGRLTVKDTSSLLELQRDSRHVLSLEDLLSGSGHRLRGRAESLRDRLNQATACLLGELRGVRPSLRLQWAEAAEHDRLRVERPDSWPGIEDAREEDFNSMRTLAELIDWWFRQLHSKATAASRTAVRNLLRAGLLLASNDDPDELLQGRLKTPPVKLLDGDRLRVTLNREASPGTLLQLLDRNSRLVGTLRVDDFDDEGAITTITRVIDKQAIPDTGFTCTGYGLPGIKRR